MKIFEVEIYHNAVDFLENEYDIYVNYPNYETKEYHTIQGIKNALKLAKKLSKKYNVPIRENIQL